MNGAVLTIRTDTRVHANAPASFTGSLGTTSISAALGGGVLIDARNVREVWFNSGSGTVPAIGTSITQGGVAGYLLGVWADLNSLPVVVGGAMPAAGFIKMREVTGGAFAAGALGGITATATGADTVSWIEIVQRTSATNTVPRLGYFRTRGDWYYLPVTTSGSANQTVQTPSMGSANTFIPCVWIETAAGSNVYEPFIGLTNTYFLDVNLGTDVRSKFVRIIGSGQFVIGHDGTVATGYVPPAGCRMRIPNILGHQCTIGTDSVNNFPNFTMITRPDFTTTSSGNIDFEYFINDWYHSLTAANEVIIKHCASFDSHSQSNTAQNTYIEDYHIGTHKATLNPLLLQNCQNGGKVIDCRFYRADAVGSGHPISLTGCFDFEFDNIYAGVVQYTRSSGRAISISQCIHITLNDIYQINSYSFFATSFNITLTNLDHTDRIKGNTDALGVGSYAIRLTASSDNIMVDGVTFGLKGTLAGFHNPYLGIFSSVQCSNVTFRNAGTKAAPLLCENDTNACQYIYVEGSANNIIRVQRAFLNITRSALFNSDNTSKNYLFESLGGSNGASRLLCVNGSAKDMRSASLGTTAGTAVYGTHYLDVFTSDTTGNVGFAMNEPTVQTAPYVSLVLAGTAGGFTAAGQAAMPNVGDELNIEMNYFAQGHTAFQNVAPTYAGTNPSTTLTFTYDIDTGSGYSGTYKTLDATNLSGETLDPAIGFKLKIKVVTHTAGSTNALTSILLATSSTLVAQLAIDYPLDLNFVTLSTSNVLADSRVQIYNTTTSEELYNEFLSTGNVALTFDTLGTSPLASDGDIIRYRVTKKGYLGYEQTVVFSDISGGEAYVQQVVDVNYVANGIDGATVTEFILDGANVQIDINDPDGATTVQRGYAWYSNVLTTEDGIRYAFGGFEAIDTITYRANADVMPFQFDNVGILPVHITGGYVYRSDGANLIADTSYSIWLDAGKAYIAGADAIAEGVRIEMDTNSTKLESINSNMLTTGKFLGLK
jgi:hypothetical protein